MNMIKLYVILFLLLSLTSQAKEDENSAVELKQQYDKALTESPANPLLLYNSGWADYKNNLPALALAKWRKALSIQPSQEKAKEAIKHILEKNPNLQQASSFSGWDLFVETWVRPTPKFSFYLLTIIVSHLFFWSLFKYLGARNKAIKDEASMPSPPPRLYYLSVFFVFLISFSIIKLYYGQLQRGSVVEPELALRISPSEDATKISQVGLGSLVYFLKRKQDWVQIKVGSGNSGWVPAKSVYQITE